MNFYKFLRSLLPREIRNEQSSWSDSLKSKLGYYRFRTRVAAEGAPVPDLDLYRPLYSPWLGDAAFRAHFDVVKAHTLVSPDRCWVLRGLITQALALPGDFAEFGVYRGGTALLAARLLAERSDRRMLHLFDSFAGMPRTSEGEPYNAGDFGQTSAAAVQALVEPAGANVRLHVGFIPGTFAGLELPQLAFAHIDLDLYQSILDCVEFVYPRLVPGGIIVFDDYGFPGCVRAREATDRAFAGLPEKPIYLPTGQAIVIKLPKK